MSTETAAHTPGPWMLTSGTFVYALTDNPDFRKGQPEKINRFSCDIQRQASAGCSLDEAIANARLIAAAPDLLAVVKAYRAKFGHCGDVAERADAAIKKALGV